MMKWIQKLGLAAPTKRSALFFLLSSVLLTALIGSGLGFLALKPGMPLPSLVEGVMTLEAPAEAAPIGMGIGSFAGILAAVLIGGFFLLMIIQVIRGVPWKKLLPGLLSLFGKILLGISILIVVVMLLPKPEGAPPEAMTLPAPVKPVFAPLGAAPSVLLWLAAIGILALILVLVARVLAKRKERPAGGWEIAAEQALQALQDGEDVKEVILECYRRMSRALQEEQGIERESFMTAGEFEGVLASKGLPPSPVHRLTALFESARYSRAEPTPLEERDAMTSLEEILSSSRARRAG